MNAARAILVLTFVFAALGRAHGGSDGPPGATRVAVLAFDAAGSDAGWDGLGAGLQSMLTTDLASLAALRPELAVIERARLKDLGAELRLGASGLVDARSAAKIGKLLGATHVVVGGYTLVGARLRIDARLVRLDSGAVVATATSEGEREAFFELEKDVARRLIEGLGTPLSARERAALAPIATANLDALHAFGDGLTAADGAREAEALAALRRAAELDPAFALARHTLDEYERMVAEARAHAAAAQAAADQAEVRVAAVAEAVQRAAIADLMRRYDHPKAPSDKPIAALLLAGVFNGGYGVPTQFRELHARNDAFALRRLRDRWYTNYLASAESVPEVPLPHKASLANERIRSAAQADLDVFFAELSELAMRTWTAGNSVVYTIRHAGQMAHLDLHATIALGERLVRRATQRIPGDAVGVYRELADSWLRLAETDRAATVLGRAREATTDPSELARIAEALELGAALHAELGKSDQATQARREYAALMGLRDDPRAVTGSLATCFGEANLSAKALRCLWRARTMGSTGQLPFLLLDELPTFPVAQKTATVWHTPRGDGRRADPWRTEGLAFGGEGLQTRHAPIALWVLGDHRLGDLTLELTVTPTRPPGLEDDYTFRNVKADEQPALLIIVGVETIEPGPQPKGAPRAPNPTGLAIRIDAHGSSLLRFAAPLKGDVAWEDMRFTPIASAPPALSTTGATKVRLTRKGADLMVTTGANGTSSTHFTLPAAAPDGWLLLGATGAGYLAMTDVRLK